MVFKLHPTANGWKQTVLYNFQGGPNDGAEPLGNLVFDHEGNLYGTTSRGLVLRWAKTAPAEFINSLRRDGSAGFIASPGERRRQPIRRTGLRSSRTPLWNHKQGWRPHGLLLQ